MPFADLISVVPLLYVPVQVVAFPVPFAFELVFSPILEAFCFRFAVWLSFAVKFAPKQPLFVITNPLKRQAQTIISM